MPTIKEAQDTQTLAVLTQASELQGEAKKFPIIKSDTQEQKAILTVKNIKTMAKAIEERRKALKKPHLDGAKAIDEWLSPQVKALVSVADELTKTITSYRKEKEEKARIEQERLEKIAAERQAKIDEIAKKKGIEAPQLNVPTLAPVQKNYGGISVSANWDFKITDLDKIPRTMNVNGEIIELMVPNEVALRKLAKTFKSELEIPGVEAYDKGRTSVRL